MAGKQAVQDQDDDLKAQDAELEGKKPAEGADDDFTIIETDDAGRPLAVETDEEHAEGEGDDERQQPEDARLLSRGGRVDETAEQRRARRKQERHRRKTNQRNTIAENRRLQAENAQLRQIADRVSGVEGTVGQISVAAIDGRLNELGRIYKEADASLIDAVSKGDGERASRALTARGSAEREFHELRTHKEQLTKGPERDQPAPAQIPPEVEERLQEFQEEFPWYNMAQPMSDPDSATVITLDKFVVKAGYKPDTDEYWEELKDLMRERLPHKFGQGRQNGDARPNGQANERPAPRRGGPPVGGGNDTRPLGQNEVIITPARKAAMVDAGIWDDPARRKKQLAAYREYDKVHGRPGQGA